MTHRPPDNPDNTGIPELETEACPTKTQSHEQRDTAFLALALIAWLGILIACTATVPRAW